MRNLVHGNSIAAKENSRNNFYLLSLPSPWEEAMIRNSHSLGVGKKLNRGTIWETHERGNLNKIGRSQYFRLVSWDTLALLLGCLNIIQTFNIDELVKCDKGQWR